VGRLVPQLHLDATARRSNGHVPVSEAPHEVEGLLHWLLQRQPQRVGLHRGLDGCLDLWCRPEVPVGRDEAANALVRALEVVGLDEEGHPPLAVGEVTEDGAGEKLVPQRLPEALHLPERHRVVGATLHVADAGLPQQHFEGRLPPPGRVLPSLVCQHLLGRAVRRHAPLERLEHQSGPLVVSQHVTYDEAAVVVEEGCHVHPGVASKQEGEDVGLPELVRLGPLEARLRWLGLGKLGRPVLQQSLLVQNPPHRGLAHPEPFEALQQRLNPARAVLRVLPPHPRHGSTSDVVSGGTAWASGHLRLEGLRPSELVLAQPVVDRLPTDAESPRDVSHRGSALQLVHHFELELHRVAAPRRHHPPSSSTPARHCPSLLSGFPCQGRRGGGC